ncbi:MAG: leucyl aminopeptidase [Nitrospiria bacterium]
MMDVQVKSGALTKMTGDLLIFTCFEGKVIRGAAASVDRKMAGELRKIVSSEGFKGVFLETILIRTKGAIGFQRLILLGLGKRSDITEDRFRQGMGKGVSLAQKIGATHLWVPCDLKAVGFASLHNTAQTIVEGLSLSLYRFDRLKTAKKSAKKIEGCTLLVPSRTQVSEAQEGARHGNIIAEGVHYVRDLCNLPANIVTPSYLAKEAETITSESGMEVEVLERSDIQKIGMGAFHAVTQGTAESPKFIYMSYRGAKGKKGKPVALIGKSVTFDTGGISLKPGERMEQMKYDMSGGATVLGVMKVIGRLKLPVDVIAFLPATDNMPSGSAVHPGDVVTTLSGKTVEVDNTDAEGRLCLADALSYAARYKPAVMIDLATLTGACVVALGQHAVGLMGNNDALIAEILAAGKETGEPLWQLPLWDVYFKQIEGEVADLKNVGGRAAGTITAGLFLKQFVEGIPWAHLDIAGTSWYSDGNHPYISKGATGVGLRLLVRYLMQQSKRKKR